jgi:hypothetical protein
MKKVGQAIGVMNLCVAEYREIIGVMRGKKRKKESPDRMVAEIRRHIADPQWTFGLAVVGMRLNEFPEWFGMLLVPAPMFLIDHPGVAAGMKMESEG